ncbi:MAG: SRPBCC family protein [Deltaproteobacteria bacterium]|nr:SRPBCC family protein [Deltaproteobacteria bacterium]
MIKIAGQVKVERPPAQTFESLGRWADWPLWWTACCRAELESGTWQAGARLNLILTPHKMTYSLPARVVDHRPPEAVGLAAGRWGVRGGQRWLFQPQEGGCLVEEIITLSGPGLILFRALGQVEALGLMVKRNLNGFKNFVEKQA